MKIHNVIIGLALFSMFMISGGFIFQGLIDAYPNVINVTTNVSTRDTAFTETFNLTEELYADALQISNDTMFPDAEGGDATWVSLIKSGYKSIRLVGNSFRLIPEIFSALQSTFGIPKFFIGFATVMLIVMIVFTIIYMVFKAN